MAAVVARLVDQHYLDDPAFASTYTRLRQENQSFGKRRVQQELTRKGVQAELVASTLETAYAQVSEDGTGAALRCPQADQETARRKADRPRDSPPGRRGFFFRRHLDALKTWDIDIPETDLSEPEDA